MSRRRALKAHYRQIVLDMLAANEADGTEALDALGAMHDVAEEDYPDHPLLLEVIEDMVREQITEVFTDPTVFEPFKDDEGQTRCMIPMSPTAFAQKETIPEPISSTMARSWLACGGCGEVVAGIHVVQPESLLWTTWQAHVAEAHPQPKGT